MCRLLESVVTEGTAKNANVLGFSIGGKTGTSEKIDVFDEKGQRVLDKIVSFVGIAPMDDPQYIVLVALDTPSRSTGMYISGGVMAAPTVGAVMADILPYLGVHHSYPEDDPAGKMILVENFTGMETAAAEKLLKSQKRTYIKRGAGEQVTDQLPAPGQSVTGNTQVILYCGEMLENEKVKVPDFTGMTRQQASDAAGKLGLYVIPAGNPEVSPHVTVTEQSIPKDTEIPVGRSIQLTFTDLRRTP